MATSTTKFTLLSDEIRLASQALNAPGDDISLQEKQMLLVAARELVDKLEGPEIAIWRVVFGPQANAALRSAFEMRIFEEFGPNIERMTAQQLEEKTGVEKMLLVRIMRGLTCSGIFLEVEEETYTHNARSKQFTNPMFRAMMRGLAGIFSPYMNKMPEYLASISFRNPDLAKQNLFQYAMQTDMEFFDWLHTQPKDLEIFSATMAASSAFQQGAVINMVSGLFPHKTDPASNHLSLDEDQVLLVDVGGGRGTIMNEVRKARPDLKGAIIVQDLPKEIEGREPSEGIQSMVYDFFKPQPVKGAHTYFFRHIFHDWPDSACRSILQQTVPAMTKGYSRLIIFDSVLPNVERTERHWRNLMSSEGLQVTYILPPRAGRGDSIIEVMLK